MVIVLVVGTYYVGLAITIEASLSFLGVGVPPDIPSWGGMLKRAAEEYGAAAPWVAIFPSLAIFVVVRLVIGFGRCLWRRSWSCLRRSCGTGVLGRGRCV